MQGQPQSLMQRDFFLRVTGFISLFCEDSFAGGCGSALQRAQYSCPDMSQHF